MSFPGDEQVEEEPGEEGPAAGVLLGSLVVVVVLVLVLALLVRCLWARRGQEGHRGRGKSRGYAPPEKPGGGLSGEYWAGLPGGGALFGLRLEGCRSRPHHTQGRCADLRASAPLSYTSLVF